jgi:hypothetical protein
MNTKPKINTKRALSPPGPAGDGGCPLQHVRTLVGLSRHRFARGEILGLIDRREIGWAWDISRKDARRPEIRIWHESVLAYLARENGGDAPPPARYSIDQILALVLPKADPLAPRTAGVGYVELQRRPLCSRQHLNHLIADGELCQIRPCRPSRTPAILYQSAVEFLRRRCLSV